MRSVSQEITCIGRSRRGVQKGTSVGGKCSGGASSPLLPALGCPEESLGEAPQLAPWGTRWAAAVSERTGAVTEIQTPILTHCVMWGDTPPTRQLRFLICKMEQIRPNSWVMHEEGTPLLVQG